MELNLNEFLDQVNSLVDYAEAARPPPIIQNVSISLEMLGGMKIHLYEISIILHLNNQT